jgi:hypothetical protein
MLPMLFIGFTVYLTVFLTVFNFLSVPEKVGGEQYLHNDCTRD